MKKIILDKFGNVASISAAHAKSIVVNMLNRTHNESGDDYARLMFTTVERKALWMLLTIGGSGCNVQEETNEEEP